MAAINEADIREISNQENVQEISQTLPGLQTSFHEQVDGVNNYFYLSNSSVNIDSTKDKTTQSVYPSAFENIIKSTKLSLKHLESNLFVETQAFKEARSRLDAFGVVVVTGRQGDGKTAIGLHCLQSMAGKRKPVVMTDPYDWDTMPRPQKWHKQATKERFVVLIDNMFGYDEICPTIKHRWMSKFEQMWYHVLYGHVALILLFRTSIFYSCKEQLSQFKLFQTTHILSLSNPKFQLNPNEKTEIAECYTKKTKNQENIDLMSIASSLPNIAFPQICHFFATSKNVQSRGLNYFQNPIEYFTKELQVLREQNSLQYFILVLTMILRGQLSKQLFYAAHTTSDIQKKQDDLDVAKQVRRFIPFSFDMKTTNFESEADSMIGVYLSYSNKDKSYQFLHPVIEDALLVSFSDICLRDIIAICPVRVLNQYMRTPSCNRGETKLAVQISRQEMIFLANRVAAELTEGDYLAILTHPALSHDDFVTLLTEKVLKEEGCRIISKRNIGLVHVHKIGPFLNASDVTLFDAPLISTVWIIDKWLCNYKTLLCLIVMQNLPNLAFMITKQLPKYFERRLLRCACFIGMVGVVKLIVANIGKSDKEMYIREVLTCCVASDVESIPILNALLTWISDYGESDMEGTFPSLLTEMLRLTVALRKVKYLKLFLRTLRKYDVCSSVLNDLLYQFLVQQPHIRYGQPMDFKTTGNILSILIKEGAAGYQHRLIFLASRCVSSYVLEQLLDHLGWTDVEYTIGKELIVERRETVLADKKILKSTLDSTPLLEASKVCLDSVRLLLKHGADVNVADADGYTILHSSLIYSDSETLKHVLKMKTSPNLPEKKGLLTPLHVASEYAPIAFFSSFLQNTDTNARTSDGKTALHIAINSQIDSLAKVSALLKAGACINDGLPVLHTAIDSHLYAFAKVEALIEAGADVRAVDQFGKPVLYVAVEERRLETVSKLIELRLDVNETDTKGNTPLHIALQLSFCRSGETYLKDVVEVLLANGANIMKENELAQTSVYLAAKTSSVPSGVLDLLLKNKLVHQFHILQLKNNPLSCVSSIEKAQILVKYGFCPSAECAQQCLLACVKNSRFSLNFTFENGKVINGNEEELADTWEQRIELICANGADINLRDDGDRTPLHVAISDRNTDMVKCLLKKGADPNIKDICGNIIPYQYCRYRKKNYFNFNYETIEMLVTAGARLSESSNRYAMLMHCAENGLCKSLQLLVDSGIKTNICTEDGRSLVHSAVTSWKCLHIVMQQNISVNLQDIQGYTALHLVVSLCWSGDKISYLIYNGADADKRDLLGRTPLIISSLLSESLKIPPKDEMQKPKQKPKKIHGREKYTKPVLWKNAKRKISRHPYGYNKNAEVLLKHGADGDIKTIYGDTALHIAVEKCNYGLLCILVQGGCSSNIKNADGNTPLHLTLISSIKKKTKIMKALVNGKCDVNVQNDIGDTALHIACHQGLTFVVSLLMEKKANPEVINKSGDTALHIAAQRGWWKSVKVLLDKGADPKSENLTEETPLHLAASRGHSRTMAALIEAGGDTDAKDVEGCTAIHKAAMNGRVRAGKMLVQDNCDVTAVNNKGETDLHIAARHGQFKMAQLLMDNGCNVNAVNKVGDTPLHISVREVRYRMTKTLLKNGADVHKENSKGQTAIDICSIIRDRRGYSHHVDRMMYVLSNSG